MSIKESALSAISTITQSDFIRAVTAAGASRRVTVANLAKAIIESYTGSSLAGASQSVKSAIDALNSKTATSVDITATTSGTGAIQIPSAVANGTFICACSTDGRPTLIFRRDLGYLTVKDNATLATVTNTEVSIKIWYIPN